MATSVHQEQVTKSNESISRPPYVHWIHCNVCYEQYMKKSRRFYLLACDHVCCEQCVKNISEPSVNGPPLYKCPLCGQETYACRMGNDMPSHLKELFHPEPWLDGLNTYRLMVFQEKHHKRFMDHLNSEQSAIEEAKNEVQRIKERCRKYYKELEEFKTKRKQLEKRVRAIRVQRMEQEEKKSNSKNSSSSSGVPKDVRASSAPNINARGITSFPYNAISHSFIL